MDEKLLRQILKEELDPINKKLDALIELRDVIIKNAERTLKYYEDKERSKIVK